MFLPSSSLLKTRISALHNFAELTATQLDVIERVSELMASTTRAGFDRITPNGILIRPNEAVESTPDTSIALQFVDQMFDIAWDSQKALIKSAEAQIQMFDEIVFAAIERASNFSPREAEGGFETMNIVLKSAEDTLHDVSSRVVHTVELSEQEFHEATRMVANATSRKTTRAAAPKAKKAAELPGTEAQFTVESAQQP